jgi:hypothetical protein
VLIWFELQTVQGQLNSRLVVFAIAAPNSANTLILTFAFHLLLLLLLLLLLCISLWLGFPTILCLVLLKNDSTATIETWKSNATLCCIGSVTTNIPSTCAIHQRSASILSPPISIDGTFKALFQRITRTLIRSFHLPITKTHQLSIHSKHSNQLFLFWSFEPKHLPNQQTFLLWYVANQHVVSLF